jgi:hypothetical protein
MDYKHSQTGSTLTDHTVDADGKTHAGFLIRKASKEIGFVWTSSGVWHFRSVSGKTSGTCQHKHTAIVALVSAYDSVIKLQHSSERQATLPLDTTSTSTRRALHFENDVQMAVYACNDRAMTEGTLKLRAAVIELFRFVSGRVTPPVATKFQEPARPPKAPEPIVVDTRQIVWADNTATEHLRDRIAAGFKSAGARS